MQVAELHVFPVKSMAGFSPGTAWVRRWGLEGDRRYMVVRPDGVFLTQRDLPGLALIRPEVLPQGVLLSADGLPPVTAVPEDGRLEVVVWKDRVSAATCGAAVDGWLSEALKTPCRLVYLDDPSMRLIAARWRQGAESVSFADGFPVLLTSLASLGALNAQLERPVRINRFRGNIVVTGRRRGRRIFGGSCGSAG